MHGGLVTLHIYPLCLFILVHVFMREITFRSVWATFLEIKKRNEEHNLISKVVPIDVNLGIDYFRIHHNAFWFMRLRSPKSKSTHLLASNQGALWDMCKWSIGVLAIEHKSKNNRNNRSVSLALDNSIYVFMRIEGLTAFFCRVTSLASVIYSMLCCIRWKYILTKEFIWEK